MTEAEKSQILDQFIGMKLAAEAAEKAKAEAAEKAFKTATEMDPKSVDAQMALANFYWVTGRGAEAESALKKSVQIAPENASANRALATFYIATNRAAEAETYLKKVYDVTALGQTALADWLAEPTPDTPSRVRARTSPTIR